jgi:hypothetical protein
MTCAVKGVQPCMRTDPFAETFCTHVLSSAKQPGYLHLWTCELDVW